MQYYDIADRFQIRSPSARRAYGKRKDSICGKHIKQRLSEIGAKVVRATEMSFSAKQLCDVSNRILMDEQTEIAELYECLADIVKTLGHGK